ncbi:MAG: nucleoside deaminase [Coprococcus sp.]|jgi:tRNA(Arg) A34 adenosine deaminase TadA|uniref:nucleoside deaminase n=1 Tax=Coprococcus catus TaxID=116085 RepID=UPI002079760A|nr:nucleoside deaminase [Coprococcus catus]
MMTKSFENDSDTNHGLNSHRKPEDASFMREAIRLSQLAVEHGNEPFGAVLVKNGKIVFTNENQIYTRHDPTFHGEAGLIREFCAKTSITDLHDYTLYSSCEPCFMCSGAMVWVKLGRLVYGASNSDLEAILGNEGCNCSKIVFDNSFWQPQVTAGILRDESLMILKDYFDTHAKG